MSLLSSDPSLPDSSLPDPSLPDFLSSKFDVLVIGAGAAGLYTTLCLPPHLKVGLISKESLSLSASDWAQGGIAAVVDPQDSSTLHIQDTLQAGAGLCDRDAVKFLVEQAPRCIQALVDMGVGFDRQDGTLALTLEAAHSRRRVLHAADTTGRAVVSRLTAEVMNRDNIQLIQAFTLDLWMDAAEQRCRGISLLYGGQIVWLAATVVILATGGGGQVFAQTTNPALSTGDGVAIAHRAGAIVRDLEFVQFHPTALIQPGAPRFLISEAVRGEGAHLVDEQGRRFAFDYHPDGELAPRDVVSRAIFSYLQKTHPDPTTAHVGLDLRAIPRDRIQHRFPNIIQVCQKWGIDVFHEPIPVAPAAHYWMGGIATDLLNRTSIAGLYAVGETASTGVHGANRLASNSLLECLVFGAQFAHLDLQSDADKAMNSKSEWQNSQPLGGEKAPAKIATPISAKISAADLSRIESLRQEIPRVVWQGAGISRDCALMEQAIAQINLWQAELDTLPISQTLSALLPGQLCFVEKRAADPIAASQAAEDFPTQSVPAGDAIRLWAETRNLLAIAQLILTSAHFRTESRGGHFRTDYPHPDPAWQVHTLVQGDRRWTEGAG